MYERYRLLVDRLFHGTRPDEDKKGRGDFKLEESSKIASIAAFIHRIGRGARKPTFVIRQEAQALGGVMNILKGKES